MDGVAKLSIIYFSFMFGRHHSISHWAELLMTWKISCLYLQLPYSWQWKKYTCEWAICLTNDIKLINVS